MALAGQGKELARRTVNSERLTRSVRRASGFVQTRISSVLDFLTRCRHLGTNRFLDERLSDNVLIAKSTTSIPNDQSRCLVNHLHLFFIHPATVHFDFRDSSVDLTKIRGRKLNIDGS